MSARRQNLVHDALREGMINGYELGLDAAIDLARRIGEAIGDDVLVKELERARAGLIANAKKTIVGDRS